MTNLVLQSFGKENEYKRAILTILSFFAHNKLAVEQTKVILFTDRPEFFTGYVRALPVEFVLLTPEKIRQMRGTIDFLHRMKIALIEEAFRKIDGSMLYADSDTFFIKDPASMLEQVSENVCFMHTHEYEFESMRQRALPGGKTFKAFLELIESREFMLSDGSKIKVTPQHSSWNAGVMIFHPSHAQFIQDVYALTDQFFPPTQNHASEQYAFSVILEENTEIRRCEDVIYHYWYRVKKEIIDSLLQKELTEPKTDEEASSLMRKVKSLTERLPAFFEEHMLTLKDNSIQALNENKYREGYAWAIKAFKKGAYADALFIKNVLYHFKRQITAK